MLENLHYNIPDHNLMNHTIICPTMHTKQLRVLAGLRCAMYAPIELCYLSSTGPRLKERFRRLTMMYPQVNISRYLLAIQALTKVIYGIVTHCGLSIYSYIIHMCTTPSLVYCTDIDMPRFYNAIYTREVRMFFTKTSRDVGMVLPIK